jgi:hypothetical protein
MYRIREIGLSKETGRDRDAELVRQEKRVEENIGKDQQLSLERLTNAPFLQYHN